MIYIPEDLQIGKSFKIFYNDDNVNNRIIHIRAIVDNKMVVFRWWHKRSKRWIYVIESLFHFELLNDSGYLLPR